MSKAPKADAQLDPLVPLFKSMGLTQAKAIEATKAPKSAAVLQDIIDSNTDAVTGLEEKQATLIANLAVVISKAGPIAPEGRDYVLKAVLDSRLKTIDQITGQFQKWFRPCFF